MKRMVNQLDGHELDAMVLVASGQPVFEIRGRCFRHPTDGQPELFEPSTNWSDGGPIIEREMIYLDNDPGAQAIYRWHCGIVADDRDSAIEAFGETPLTAAMRAYVASKFGEEVELP